MEKTHKELLDFCNKWLADWNELNPEKILPYYTKDCVFWEPALRKVLRGQDDFAKYIAKIKIKFSGAAWECKELFVTESGFVFRWEAHLTFRDSGKEVILPGLELVVLDGEKIARNEVYYDRTPLLKND